MTARAKVIGGAKLRKFVADAKRAALTPQPAAEVGYFEDAEYPDGTPVALVALLNEYGAKNNIETAAIRRAVANERVRTQLVRIIAKGVQPDGSLSPAALVAAGKVLAAAIAKGQPVETGKLRDSTEARLTDR